ncbi:MAG: AAA family ATPase [Chloroflexi bacterium]|nr:AAA family ATPase [Chloroflexota bacterium]MCY3937811.1 AAA family ATPase [Chloroflexota bacterium]
MMAKVEGSTVQTARDLEFQDEEERLHAVVAHIKSELRLMEGRLPPLSPTSEVVRSIREVEQEIESSLRSALVQPYFGRVDYVMHDVEQTDGRLAEIEPHDGRLQESIYLGRTHLDGTNVISWTAPAASLFYGEDDVDGYEAPAGFIRVRVDLKRFLEIRKGELQEITDRFRRWPPAYTTARQNLLEGRLARVGGDSAQLEVIVETIEPEQYRSIANVSDKVLIVQGAAGSGKSEIGLHRIAFLLSPHSDIPERERPTPGTTMFVGPSRAFLEYAAEILPDLGVTERVHQVRFSDWRTGQMSRRVQVKPRIWSELLARGNARRFNLKAEEFKGSLAMADAIERRVAELSRGIRRRLLSRGSFSVPTTPFLVDEKLIKSAVLTMFQGAAGRRPLNRRRQDFIDRIANMALSAGYGGRSAAGAEAESRWKFLRSRAERWCEREWPQLDFRGEYAALLSDAEAIHVAAGPDAGAEIARSLAASALSIPQYGFDDSDAGALAYFDHLLNGTIERRYRHVVVDEAQDISPIEFKLLAECSTNNWFTVLGDTAQRLMPYRGISGWRAVERVFGRSEIEVQRARRSYRSNVYITRSNNRILRTFDANILAPIPFERHGHRVEYNRHGNTRDMYQAVIDDIQRIRSLDGFEDSSIAVLVRDQANLNRFQQYCQHQRFTEISLITEEHYGDSRTVLARIPDVKGLEYDAVIVIGVNESFSDSTFNKRLLYLATTRARHYLGIHWSGRQSQILKSISHRGIVSR